MTVDGSLVKMDVINATSKFGALESVPLSPPLICGPGLGTHLTPVGHLWV